jgi:molybdenum cofactor guanylyltransferase
MHMTTSQITGIILAGGQGRRMGNVDKGLQRLRGKSMVEWVLERIEPQVDELLINANRNLDEYERFGYDVVPDAISGYAGPLAGLHCGITSAAHDLIATVPCDSPFLPLDLVMRLREALESQNADISVARTGDQAHPVFSICRRSVLPSLTTYLAGGGRKIDTWYSSLKVAEVRFDDETEAFRNINTTDELALNEGSK